MRVKNLTRILRPWFVAGVVTGALAGPVAADHYSYVTADNQSGPYVWGNMAGNEACGILDVPGGPPYWTGVAQSPVNISEVRTESGPALEFNYPNPPLMVSNNGHTIEVTFESGNTLSVDGVVYDLEAIQFHVNSEHKYLGTQYSMEAHMVHRNSLGEAAIVAVFLTGGATQNDFVNAVFTDAPGSGGSVDMSTVAGLSALDLLVHATTTATTMVGGTTTSEPPAEQPLSLEEERAAWKAKKQELKAKWKEERIGWKEEWTMRWRTFKAALYEFVGKGKAAREIRRIARLEYKKARKAAWKELKAQKRQEWLEFRAEKKAAMKAARQRNRDGYTPPAADVPSPGPEIEVVTGKMADTYFTYTGSLTAPPCTEGVRWLVLPHEVAVLDASVQKMMDMVGVNNRSTQPLNGRIVKHITP